MLTELAVGDAYGAGFEYVSERIVREHNQLTGYAQHPRHGIAPGAYTDDTQMSIAVAEAILSAEPWTPHLLARHFVAAFQRDPREGYAGAFFEFLQSVRDADDFLARIRPHSDKSGAAMRAGPVGVYDSIETVIDRATLQAAVTHNTPEGIAAAVAAALMTHYFLYRIGPRAELPAFIASQVPGDWRTPWRGKVGPQGVMSVRAALTAVVRCDRLSDLLHTCIAFTGDVDTVATIALGAASCSDEFARDLPTPLVMQLEDGPYGRSYLQALDERLLALACRRP